MSNGYAVAHPRRSKKEMKFLIALLPVLLLTGCGKKTEFPSEFVGRWEFEPESAREYIEGMDLPEEDIIKLSGSFPHMNRGMKMKVTENGTWTYDDAPVELKIILKVIEKREELGKGRLWKGLYNFIEIREG